MRLGIGQKSVQHRIWENGLFQVRGRPGPGAAKPDTTAMARSVQRDHSGAGAYACGSKNPWGKPVPRTACRIRHTRPLHNPKGDCILSRQAPSAALHSRTWQRVLYRRHQFERIQCGVERNHTGQGNTTGYTGKIKAIPLYGQFTTSCQGVRQYYHDCCFVLRTAAFDTPIRSYPGTGGGASLHEVRRSSDPLASISE